LVEKKTEPSQREKKTGPISENGPQEKCHRGVSVFRVRGPQPQNKRGDCRKSAWQGKEKDPNPCIRRTKFITKGALWGRKINSVVVQGVQEEVGRQKGEKFR